MSLFLGPIHHWLFGKITFQNELVNQIVSLAEREGWMNEMVRPDRYGVLEQGALEDIVDASNIHGWLQERVDLVENRLAYLVTVLTEEHPERMAAIQNEAYRFGEAHKLTEAENAKAAFAHLETILLNGMPCDHVNLVTDETDSRVEWQQTTDIHKKYWETIHGDAANYSAIRGNVIAGVLEGSGYTFAETAGNVYEIRQA